MAPSKPGASHSFARSSDHFQNTDDDLHVQQAGRTPVHLAAQSSLQSLREASRRRHSLIDAERITTPTQRRLTYSNTSENSLNRVFDRVIDFQRPSDLSRPVTSSQADESSPLSSAATTKSSSQSSRKNSEYENGTRTVSGSTAENSDVEASKSKDSLASSFSLNPPPRQNPGYLRRPLPPARFHRSQPRSIRELGTDYTRYFDPASSRTKINAGSHKSRMRPDTTPLQPPKKPLNPFADAISPSETSKLSQSEKAAEMETEQQMGSGTPDTSSITLRGPMIAPRFGEPEKSGFYEYIDDRFGAPGYDFPLITDMREDDDDMHMPLWDDDKRLKPKLRDHFTRENIVSTFGFSIMIAGLLCIFVVLPVISYTGTDLLDYGNNTPLDQTGDHSWSGPAWAHVNDRLYPLLTNVRTGLIDLDTPQDSMTRTGVNGETLKLVFSDEFNEKNRTFYPGDDAYWFGFDGWYGATEDLEWYDPDAINTGDGALLLQMDRFVNHNLNFRSGMLNSWNQVCFKGGIFEVSMSLPGPAGVHGLWPGVWTMGNLGRPGYLATTDGLWPYTYNDCDAGITPNQSMVDGTSRLPGQRLPSCTCAGEDHPTPGTGRGAPEIDIAEASADWGGLGIGVATQSYQVAPFDIWYYPNYHFMQTPNYSISFVNTYTGGPYQQAVSTTTMLNNNWYDGNEYQKFAYEYSPGTDADAFVAWTIADDEMMRFDARAIGPNGNIGQRVISEEPMSIILNLGISNSWTDIQWSELQFPTVFRIDYVRWYQREGAEMVTCDPPGFETTEFIKQHPKAYNDPNVTHWVQAGYDWPKNSFMDGCSP